MYCSIDKGGEGILPMFVAKWRLIKKLEGLLQTKSLHRNSFLILAFLEAFTFTKDFTEFNKCCSQLVATLE